jgi:hypothetical protein
MAYALIDSVSVEGNGNTAAIDTRTADLLVAFVAVQDGGEGTFSDSQSNTWTALTTQANTVDGRLYYVFNPAVNASHTFSCNGIFPTVYVLAFSGAATSPFDQQNGTAIGSGTTIQPGSVTPTEDNELIVVGLATNGDITAAIDGGFTIAQSRDNTGTGFAGAIAYLIQTTATAANPQWSGFNNYATANIATFKAATVVASVPVGSALL